MKNKNHLFLFAISTLLLSFASQAKTFGDDNQIQFSGCYIAQQSNGEYVVYDPWNRELGRSLSMARATEIKINAENQGLCGNVQPPNPPTPQPPIPQPPTPPPQPPYPPLPPPNPQPPFPNPPTPQPPNPPQYGNEQSPVYVGQRVINIVRNYVQVTIIAVENDGDFVIRFEEGSLAGQIGGNWDRSDFAILSGCSSQGFCVGDRVINTSRNYAYAQVVGLEYDGEAVIRFLDGSLVNGIGGNWDRFDLAKTSGCSGDVCVGQVMLNIERDYAQVRVLAIEQDGEFVLDFLTGNLAGRRGGNWSRSALARF